MFGYSTQKGRDATNERRPTPSAWVPAKAVASIRAILLGGAIITAFANCDPALAKKGSTIGPGLDLKVVIPLDLPIGKLIHTQTQNGSCYLDDSAAVENWTNPEARQIQGVGYCTPEKGTGNVLITTIYGKDLDPHGSDLSITGYDPNNPDFTVSDEQMIGKSGKHYFAETSEVIRIGDLASRLGKDFDLSPFKSGDPNSVVFLFQTPMPSKDQGQPDKGIMFSEDFANAYHIGAEDPNGSFNGGWLPATRLQVVSGNADILGVLNGTRGACNANPAGNCLDLIGDQGNGALQSIAGYSLDSQHSYTIQFSADTGVLGDSASLDFDVSLGQFQQRVTAKGKSHQFELHYTPTGAEVDAHLGFASVTNVDGMHGPVVSNIVLCVHNVGSKNLRCKTK